jgi:hypothetical protein
MPATPEAAARTRAFARVIGPFLLLTPPQLIKSAAAAAMNMMPIVRIGFGVLVLIGLWLTFVGWIARRP